MVIIWAQHAQKRTQCMNRPHKKQKAKALIKVDQQTQIIRFQKLFFLQKYHLF